MTNPYSPRAHVTSSVGGSSMGSAALSEIETTDDEVAVSVGYLFSIVYLIVDNVKTYPATSLARGNRLVCDVCLTIGADFFLN